MSSSMPESKTSASNIEVRPLSVHTGAEIHGVDLTAPLPTAQVAAIRAALLKWKVVFFRGQHIDHAQHSRFASYFGELTPAHVVFGGHDQQFPEIYSVAKFRTANVHEGRALQRPWSEWHTDLTAAVNPPFASILRGVVVPPYGGDTQFVNMAQVCRSLSATLRDMLRGVRCVHHFVPPEGAQMTSAYKEKLNSNELIAEHPAITVHPETGEEVLYVNPGFVQSISGLNPNESRALLELLYEQSIRPEYMVRFKWEPGSIAFWDNRSTMHLAPADIFDTDFERQFYRVTLMGDRPTGNDGSRSELLSGREIEALAARSARAH